MFPEAEFETMCRWIKFLKEREHLYFNLDVSHLQRSCIGWLLCNYEEHQTIFTCTKSQNNPHIDDDADNHIVDSHHSWSKWFWPSSTFVQLEEELVRQRVARKWYLVVIGDCPTWHCHYICPSRLLVDNMKLNIIKSFPVLLYVGLLASFSLNVTLLLRKPLPPTMSTDNHGKNKFWMCSSKSLESGPNY